jgi:hypothetical protein
MLKKLTDTARSGKDCHKVMSVLVLFGEDLVFDGKPAAGAAAERAL